MPAMIVSGCGRGDVVSAAAGFFAGAVDALMSGGAGFVIKNNANKIATRMMPDNPNANNDRLLPVWGEVM